MPTASAGNPLQILIVLTSHDRLGDTGFPTGFYYEELATPYWALLDAGFEVNIASPRGGRPPHDPTSLKPEAAARTPAVTRFLADREAGAKLAATLPVGSIDPVRYAGLFLPGGHGTMWDLPGDLHLARLVGTMFNASKAVAAVCHGPAGLVAARRADGRPVVEGRRVNSFTDAEEEAVDLTQVVPFLLEARLRALGGHFESGPRFCPYAVRDGNLATGQNPASSAAVAGHVMDILRAAAWSGLSAAAAA
ncbi:MAG TPA: type 1 glutamine amidotransferase domain-containing protein [Falsiroseomonas sp.]|jgi:putative intracellular protease/amidase|nr:type 1 glutamine amidotransferase domain-containing protein [Falsiroseomonas sp.]